MNRGFANIAVIVALVVVVVGAGWWYLDHSTALQDKIIEPDYKAEEERNKYIAASIAATPTSGVVPFTTKIAARIEIPHNSPGTGIVFFGDGTSDLVTRTGPTLYVRELTHTYTKPGEYEVLLVLSSTANIDAEIEALKNQYYYTNTIVKELRVAAYKTNASTTTVNGISFTIPAGHVREDPAYQDAAWHQRSGIEKRVTILNEKYANYTGPGVGGPAAIIIDFKPNSQNLTGAQLVERTKDCVGVPFTLDSILGMRCAWPGEMHAQNDLVEVVYKNWIVSFLNMYDVDEEARVFSELLSTVTLVP